MRKRQRYESDAEECRQRGFKVGDRLVGDDGRGPAVIELCYIGDHRILAHTISLNGISCDQTIREYREEGWTLTERDWEKVKP